MHLRKFIEFEAKKVTSRRYIAVVLVFLVASGYFIQFGISQYKHILEEKNNFLEFEREKYKQFFKPSIYGNYGLRLLFVPSPFMAFFDGGPVPVGMTAFMDGSERMKIYQPLKGQRGFTMITSAFMTFAGFILLFGSGLALLYGFSGSKGHEWLKFLEELAGDRKRLFLYQLISKTFTLLLFCLVLAGLSIILFIINGVSVNLGGVLIISLGIFIMLFCFLFGGLITGTLKSRFWGWSSMVISWFLMAFIIPVLIYHFTYLRAGSITSAHKMETKKQKAFWDYEKNSFKKEGTFNDSKKGTENEKQMFLHFWDNGFKKAMRYEKNMLNEMKNNASFFQTLAGFFPTTFFISINNEMSSRGFFNLLAFNAYTQEKKIDFIWYIAQNHIFSTGMVFPPFIKKNENIYQGQSRLPGNYGFGMAVTLIWLIVLFSLYWIRFNRMLDRTRDTKRELSPHELKKNKTNVIFTSDKGLLPQLIAKLKLQNIPFVSVPGPASLPGDIKIKNLFSLFDLDVPEALKKTAGKYVYALEPDDKGRILSEITRSLKADVLIFNNFLAGLSDDLINHFVELLKSLKKGRTIVYFTNSLMVTTLICDCGIKWTKEKMTF
jgi:ABC-type transport system involved in multi-copper enzyme maturation permease subunit